VASKKLGELRKKSPRFGHAVRMIKALAYLPPEKVKGGFIAVHNYLDRHAEEICKVEDDAAKKITTFLTYLKRLKPIF